MKVCMGREQGYVSTSTFSLGNSLKVQSAKLHAESNDLNSTISNKRDVK